MNSRRILRWHGAAAPYFDVVLWRDGSRIFDAWPVVPTVEIPRRWSHDGRRYELAEGTYLWFVYPGIGARARAQYGPLVASGSFTVA